ELGVAGGQAGDPAAVREAGLQDIECLGHGRVDRHEVAAPACAGLGDREHLLFGTGEDLAAVAAVGLETVVDDAGADLDQLPQHRLVAHNLGVGGDVRRRRRGAGQFDQVGTAGHLLGQALRLEPFAQRHRVVGAVLLGQLADRAVDQLVVAAVEVAVDQLVRDAVVRLGRQHQAAEHRLFGLHRLWRHAQLLDAVLAALECGSFVPETRPRAHQYTHSPRQAAVPAMLFLLMFFPERHRRQSSCGFATKQPLGKLWISDPWIGFRRLTDCDPVLRCSLERLVAAATTAAPTKKRGALRRPSFLNHRDDQGASGSTITLTGVSTSACRCTMTSNSPVVRKAPSPITTSDFSTGVPALVSASAMSRGPTEPYSLPSVEALA